MADEIISRAKVILAANEKDLVEARNSGLSEAMIDRLLLDRQRLGEMARGVREVAALPDPVGDVIREWTSLNGLRIAKVRVPIGVVGIIYESRPNVTSDAAVLCTKTGNATILRGGSRGDPYQHRDRRSTSARWRPGRSAGRQCPADPASPIAKPCG